MALFTRIERHTGPSKVEVHEHRAPTDASVRLLAEMERAAEKKVLLSALSKPGNVIEGVAVNWQLNQMFGAVEVRCAFYLNGRHIVVTPRLHESLLHPSETQQLLEILYKTVAEAIAAEVMKAIAVEGHRYLQR